MVHQSQIPTTSKLHQCRSAAMVYWGEWEDHADISQPQDDWIHLNILTQESATFSVKNQIVNTVGLWTIETPVPKTQPAHCRPEAATDTVYGSDRVPIPFYRPDLAIC